VDDSDLQRCRGLVVFGVILAVAVIAVALIAGRTVKQAKSPARTIVVKGYAQRQITSDWGIWQVELSARSQQIAPSYAKIENDSKLTLNFLAANHVPADATEVSAISIQPLYKKLENRETNEIEFYELRQTITVSSKDVKLIDKVSREISALIKDGVEIKSQRPSFFYSQISDMKVQMLAEAAKDGQNKAVKIAENSGAKLGRLASAQQGIFQITPVHSFEISDSGFFDTTSVDKMIRAIVTEGYAVE
jgi:uncharacterized protein